MAVCKLMQDHPERGVKRAGQRCWSSVVWLSSHTIKKIEALVREEWYSRRSRQRMTMIGTVLLLQTAENVNSFNAERSNECWISLAHLFRSVISCRARAD